MVKKTLIAIVLSLSLPLASDSVFGQEYLQGNCCESGNYGSHDFSIGHNYGLYSSNCGRRITTQQAAGLWSNYCNDDCSLNRGCGHRCPLFGRFLGRGCFNGDDECCDTGCDSYGFDGGGYVTDDCGCDAGSGGGCFSGGHGCGLLRGLFGLGRGGGCGCYQGCFGYPNSLGRCGGFGRGGFGGFRSGSGRGGCGCGLLHGATGAAYSAKSKLCCAVQGFGRFGGGLKNKLFGCGLFRHGCGQGIGNYGFQGGYFYDAPISTSQNFGFYSSGCANGCDAGYGSYSSGGEDINHNVSYPPIVSGPTPSGCNSGCGGQSAVPVSQGDVNQTVPIQQSMPLNGSSFSPAGEIVPGQVVGEGAAAADGN